MKDFFKNISAISFGQWSLVLFLIALFSGFVLMLPFDVTRPYQAISAILLNDPYASLVRNIHYWSAQLFLLALLLHFYEYFKKKESVRLNRSIWFRLTLGLVVIFLLMFTGFLLRGDADAIQAKQIFHSLAEEIPLVGSMLSFILLGNGQNWQIVYINHVAVLTVIVVYIIFEHSRKVWPDGLAFVLASAAVFLLSWFITAPLHDNFHATVKGPWYFVGLQDLLHWLSHPGWILIILMLILFLFYLAGSKNYKIYFPARRALLLLTVFYGLLTVDGLFFRGSGWKQVFPWQKHYQQEVWGAFHWNRVYFAVDTTILKAESLPLVNGRPESCLLCHDGMKGLSASHDPSAVGCFSCHGGNPFSVNKEEAHQQMELFPGNFSNKETSCGNAACHPDITERISSSLMTTLSGMISVDRYVFNEQTTPNGKAVVEDLKHSAADQHLKNLCVRCHLGNDKTTLGPVSEESRGGGCLACHLNYDSTAKQAVLQREQKPNTNEYLAFHPSIDLKVSNDHCFGCHSRSGRISTNYEGWHETLHTPEKIHGKKGYRVVEGSRVFTYVQDDVHHALGMECIDCHHSYELMGDGKHYEHQENQQDVACVDCHTKDPETVPFDELDQESAVIASLRFEKVQNKQFVVTRKHHRPLINVWKQGDGLVLTGKNNKKTLFIKPPLEQCVKDKAHQNVSCSACHTAWAPTCIGCHNEYDPNEPGYDMLANINQRGSWVEYVGTYKALPPALGVRKENGRQEVVPVAPGMILTIDVSSFDKSLHDSMIFHRLYAPVSPHTITKKARSCESCHNNSYALGYGTGKLFFQVKNGQGNWLFESDYELNEHDSLPQDAWIPWLGDAKGKVATRDNLFPLTRKQQKKMLTVGACLTCHDGDSKVMKEAVKDFDQVVSKRGDQCILPRWDSLGR